MNHAFASGIIDCAEGTGGTFVVIAGEDYPETSILIYLRMLHMRSFAPFTLHLTNLEDRRDIPNAHKTP